MNTMLEWLLVVLAVVAVLCAVALVWIWAAARREERLWREINALARREFEDVEHDRREWTRFKARVKRERCALSRGLARNRRLLQ